MKKIRSRSIAHAVAMALAAGAFVGPAFAQTDNDALKRQIDSLQRQIDQLKSALEQQHAVAPAGAPAVRSPVKSNGYVELYGHLDVSVDEADKGISGKVQGGNTAVGKLGWQPDLSSNLSRIGVRGARNLGDSGVRAIFQIETQVVRNYIASR